MDKLCLSSTQTPTISRPFLPPLCPTSRARKRAFFPLSNPKKFAVSASKDDPNSNFDSNNNSNSKLNEWDLMELKFGRMLGEDPKLTLAKVMGRKINPDASFIEIEKTFNRNKGKMVEVKELPFDVPERLGSKKVNDGLNLVRPVPKEGIKVGGVGNKQVASGLNLVRPVPKEGIKVGGVGNSAPLPEIKRPGGSIKNTTTGGAKSSVPNVILRKPSVLNEKDDEMDDSLRMRIKPNLSLSMRTEPVKEQFSGMTLLKKPHPSVMEEEPNAENENDSMNGSMYSGLEKKPTNDFEGDKEIEEQSTVTSSSEVPLLEKPNVFLSQDSEVDATTSVFSGITDTVEDHVGAFTDSERQLPEVSQPGMQQPEQTVAVNSQKESGTSNSSTVRATASESLFGSVLLGRPKRLDQSSIAMPYSIRLGTGSEHPESIDGEGGPEKPPLKESEEIDWTRVEQLFKLGDRVDVELISCSPRGFVASFGSLIGFLPYRNLAAKWKFLAFESWLRKNDLDPSKYRQSLGIIGSDEVRNISTSLESSTTPEPSQKAELKITADMELEDLLRLYDQEKIQYLSSYVGQRIKVNILYADRRSRKLIFSMRPKEKEEIVEKKRTLMKKLTVGDVVKCCIKKITYFGIFVEVDGVPALVHQTEVSWDYTLDPASYLKIGEIVEAKVHQLDFSLERIFLSLKEITPDPLNEALECIVGNTSFDGGLEAAQADSEWPEVDSLIKELEEVDGVESVTKARFFLSPGLAPTFQVYMASMFEDQYKLLARSGNKVQEVIVQASLEKEEMKSVILNCTNRVEL